MVITTKFVLPLTVYLGEDGNPVTLDDEGKPIEKETVKVIHTKPGSHNYREVNHKDPRVAEQLRVYRKHNRVGFSEILQSDVEIMDRVKGSAEKKLEVLKKETGLKESPVIRHPIPAGKKMSESPNRKASKKGGDHAGHHSGLAKDEKSVAGAGKKEG